MKDSEKSLNLDNEALGSDVLLSAARPDLYRINAFRISALPIDATAHDISRQTEKLKMMEKFSGNIRQNGGPLPLDPIPNADDIREAMQRLRDPERRLVDEFFWFWPHELGQSNNDGALTALARNDLKTAGEIWFKQERGSSQANVSMHNLAILAHLAALDLEHKAESKRLADDVSQRRDSYWKEAFKRWKILLEHEGFWSRLSARIRQLDDPRLTTGTARRMRASLPLALLCINAQLAVRTAERGDTDETSRHMRIMRDSGLDQSVIDEALQRAVKPIRERIKTLCKSAESEADTDPIHADQVTKRLLDQTRPILAALDCLLTSGNATRDGAHDEVALCALSCQVSFANKTENWKTSLELLEFVQSIAASQSIRERIKENINIVRANLDHQLLYETCWFCKKRPAKKNVTIEVKMYGDITYNHSFFRFGTEVSWRQATIQVPRCAICNSAHMRPDALRVIGGILSGLVGLVSCIAIVNDNDEAILKGLLIFGVYTAIGTAIGYGIGMVHNFLRGIKSLSTYIKFPRVQELKILGWEFGEKPPNL